MYFSHISLTQTNYLVLPKSRALAENGLRDAQYPKIVHLNLLLLLNFYCIFVTTRFPLIKNTARNLLPKFYIKPNGFLPEQSYSGKN